MTTFDEWVKTERHSTDFSDVEHEFGFNPAEFGMGDPVSLVRFDPGQAVVFADGVWFTHISRSSHTGTADEIRKVLWEDYAQYEVGNE